MAYNTEERCCNRLLVARVLQACRENQVLQVGGRDKDCPTEDKYQPVAKICQASKENSAQERGAVMRPALQWTDVNQLLEYVRPVGKIKSKRWGVGCDDTCTTDNQYY